MKRITHFLRAMLLAACFFPACALADLSSQLCSNITAVSENEGVVSLGFFSGLSDTLVQGYRIKLYYDTDITNPLLITEEQGSLHIPQNELIVSVGGRLSCMKAGGISQLTLDLRWITTEKYGTHQAEGCVVEVRGTPYIQREKVVEKSVTWDPVNQQYHCQPR